MALKRRADNFIKIPSSRAMDRIKEEFHEIAGLFSLFMQTIIITSHGSRNSNTICTSLITHHWAPSSGHQCSTPAAASAETASETCEMLRQKTVTMTDGSITKNHMRSIAEFTKKIMHNLP